MSRAIIPQPTPTWCQGGEFGQRNPARFVLSCERPTRLPLVDGPNGAFWQIWLGLADAPWLDAVTGFTCNGEHLVWEYD